MPWQHNPDGNTDEAGGRKSNAEVGEISKGPFTWAALLIDNIAS